MNRIAIIRIRGEIGAVKQVKDTFKILRLYKRNTCVILKNTPQVLGMINLIKDYVTWGEINEATFDALLKSRGKLPGNKQISEEYISMKLGMSLDEFSKNFIDLEKELKDIPGLRLFFRLKPPIKGFENKGIKQPFSKGGALGYRKDKINDLIMNMI
ncbi:50S ribosomal protein L30 [Candidatus Woesearchaeota archaeon]|nr:50S ribosomal protein L30 [Candidatus Woesearchaeota archaeon]